MDDRITRARDVYEGSVFRGEHAPIAGALRDLDAVDADLALARGRLLHAEYLRTRDPAAPVLEEELALFGRAAEIYRSLGDVRGEGESLFWIGIFHQVVRREDGASVPLFTRALELATDAGDQVTQAYALRHLGFSAHAAGRLDEARARLEESNRLRRVTGNLAGVAANLVGLAHVARADGRPDDATKLLDEADRLATESGATPIARMVAEARSA